MVVTDQQVKAFVDSGRVFEFFVCHQTSKQGRSAAFSLFMPSLILVLIVPSGMPVFAAISRWLRPR